MGFLKKITNLFYVKTEEKKGEEKTENTQVSQQVQTDKVNVQNQTQQFTQNTYQTSDYPVSYPTSFAELEMLICRMRDTNQPIIISFAQATPDLAQRFVDILSGATLALNGTISNLPGNLHYFTPNKN